MVLCTITIGFLLKRMTGLMNNQINIISVIAYYIIITLLCLCVVASMQFYIDETASGVSSIALLIVSIFAFFLVILGKVRICSYEIMSIALLFSLFTFFIRIGDLISFSYNDKIRLALNVFAIPTGLCCGVYFANLINGKNRISRWNRLVLMLPLLISFYYYFTVFEIAPDGIFIIILFLPLITLHRSDFVKVLLLLVVGVCVIVSAKRSIAIAYVIILAMFGLHYTSVISNGQAKKVIQSVLILISTVLIILFFISSNNSSIVRVLDRFQDLEETGGNGRMDIYMTILNQFETSTPFEVLFGHGFNAVTENLLGHPAHNDILEVLYNYGCLSTILYSLLIFKILLLFLRRKTFDSYFSSEWLMLGIIVVLIFLVAMLNCIISSSLYEFIIYFCLGVFLQRIAKPNNTVTK